jgi:hypothetical protein
MMPYPALLNTTSILPKVCLASIKAALISFKLVTSNLRTCSCFFPVSSSFFLYLLARSEMASGLRRVATTSCPVQLYFASKNENDLPVRHSPTPSPPYKAQIPVNYKHNPGKWVMQPTLLAPVTVTRWHEHTRGTVRNSTY